VGTVPVVQGYRSRRECDIVPAKVRAYLRAGTSIPNAELQQAWDAAVDATARWVKPGFEYDAPPGVVEFVTVVAAHIWRTRDSAGDLQALPDGSFNTGQTITSSLVRRYAVLAGPYARSPRTVT
jgi:hypothetical protein